LGYNGESSDSDPGSESGTKYIVEPGTYTLTETGGPGTGYEALGWDCTGGNAEEDIDATSASIDLALGQKATCTIVNDDQSAKVKLTKKVLNTYGGTAEPNDFGLPVGGESVTSGEEVVVSANTPIALDEAGLEG